MTNMAALQRRERLAVALCAAVLTAIASPKAASAAVLAGQGSTEPPPAGTSEPGIKLVTVIYNPAGKLTVTLEPFATIPQLQAAGGKFVVFLGDEYAAPASCTTLGNPSVEVEFLPTRTTAELFLGQSGSSLGLPPGTEGPGGATETWAVSSAALAQRDFNCATASIQRSAARFTPVFPLQATAPPPRKPAPTTLKLALHRLSRCTVRADAILGSSVSIGTQRFARLRFTMRGQTGRARKVRLSPVSRVVQKGGRLFGGFGLRHAPSGRYSITAFYPGDFARSPAGPLAGSVTVPTQCK